MPAIKLPRFGTGPDAPSLRQRAAALRATVARLKRSKESLPAAGSPEAMAAFHEACSATDRLSHDAIHGYPELARADGSWWTVQALGRALDTGEVTPTEYAGLVSAAVEREHRTNAARLTTNIDALFALAYAKSYPEVTADEAKEVVEAQEASKPSAVARLAERIVSERNRINALPYDFDEDQREAMHDALAAAEFDLCDRPALTLTDLVEKVRVIADHIEEQLPLEEPRYLATRAWQGLRADIERIARGTPISGAYRELGEGTDEATRAYPVFRDEAGSGHIDPTFAAIERARFVSRQVNAPHPGDNAPLGSKALLEAEAETSRLCEREDLAFLDVFNMCPTTREGLFALIDYARERAEFAEALAERDGRIFGKMLSAIRDGAAMTLDGVREVAAPDPVFEAIQQQRALLAALNASPDDGPEADAISAREDQAWARLLDTRPTTMAGLLALVRALGAGSSAHAQMDGEPHLFAAIGDSLSALMGPPVEGPAKPVVCEAARVGRLIDEVSAAVLRADHANDKKAQDRAQDELDALRDAISQARAHSFAGALAQVCVLLAEADLAQNGINGCEKKAAENVELICFSLGAFLRRQGALSADTPMQQAFLPIRMDRLAILDRTEA